MARTIPLSRGLVALVDDEDFEELAKHRWLASVSRGRPYAYRMDDGRMVQMHRQLMSARVGAQVDHRNNDSLDNRRGNLRLCTHAQNQHNRGKPRHGTNSKYKGVCRWPYRGGWRAVIYLGRKQIFLGSFESEVLAAKAYDDAAHKYHGEFSRTNRELYPEDFEP